MRMSHHDYQHIHCALSTRSLIVSLAVDLSINTSKQIENKEMATKNNGIVLNDGWLFLAYMNVRVFKRLCSSSPAVPVQTKTNFALKVRSLPSRPQLSTYKLQGHASLYPPHPPHFHLPVNSPFNRNIDKSTTVSSLRFFSIFKHCTTFNEKYFHPSGQIGTPPFQQI